MDPAVKGLVQREFGEIRKRTRRRSRRQCSGAVHDAGVRSGIRAGVIVGVAIGARVSSIASFGNIIAVFVVGIVSGWAGVSSLIEGAVVEDEASALPGVHEIVLFGEQAVARRDETIGRLGECGVVVDLVTCGVAELLDRIGQKQTGDSLELGETNARAQVSQADDNGHRRIGIDVETTGRVGADQRHLRRGNRFR